MLLTLLLRKLFLIPLYNYYDNKFAVETEDTANSALECIVECHKMWGILFGEDKIQIGRQVQILGVGFDFHRREIFLAPSRLEALLDEIQSILKKNALPPGMAGKLKGKFYFAIEHSLGKHGRHHLRTLSERQYSTSLDAHSLC